MLKNYKFSESNFKSLFEEFDTDNTGRVDKGEMIQFIQKLDTFNRLVRKFEDIDGLIANIWNTYDTDQSGTLNKQEAAEFFKQIFTSLYSVTDQSEEFE